jgi:undecaprenyl-phosphate 4-deoxy-4-formamido-L-arabinose transferase
MGEKGITDPAPEISVVIPVFNEAPNLNELYSRVVATLEPLNRSFEVVTVDDGSSDGSYEILAELQAADPRLRIVRLARNFGQTPALYAGFANVRGRIIVQLDADLQNPPEEIVKLIAKLDEGYDVVQGWRENRQDTGFRRYASKILNRIVSWATNVKIRDLGCGLKAFRREVIDRLAHFTHHSRYLPAELVWLGARIAEVKVEHRERAEGESKYSLWSLLRLNFDMIASVTTAPIKFVGMLGLLLALVGFGMGALIFSKRIIYGNFNQFVSIVAIFFVIAGLQMTALGLLCEYVSRIFIEAQNKPYYIIREVREPETDK